MEMLSKEQRPSFILALDQLQAQTMRFKHHSAYSVKPIPPTAQQPVTEYAAWLLDKMGTIPLRTHDSLAKYELMLMLAPSEISANYGASKSSVWYHMSVHTCVQCSPLTNLEDPTWLLPVERLLIEVAGGTKCFQESSWRCFDSMH